MAEKERKKLETKEREAQRKAQCGQHEADNKQSPASHPKVLKTLSLLGTFFVVLQGRPKYLNVKIPHFPMNELIFEWLIIK